MAAAKHLDLISNIINFHVSNQPGSPVVFSLANKSWPEQWWAWKKWSYLSFNQKHINQNHYYSNIYFPILHWLLQKFIQSILDMTQSSFLIHAKIHLFFLQTLKVLLSNKLLRQSFSGLYKISFIPSITLGKKTSQEND